VPEVVLDAITGVITKLDVQEIADALEKLANNKALRTQMGEAGREFTLAHFGVQRLITDHETLYKNLLSSPTKS
jgi:glycosyltransferase involved in cell wall biosynthesis